MTKSIFFYFNFFIFFMISILLIFNLFMKVDTLKLIISLIFYSIFISLSLTKIYKSSILSYMTFFMMTSGLLVILTFFLNLTMSDQTNKLKLSFFFLFFIFLTSLYFFMMQSNFPFNFFKINELENLDLPNKLLSNPYNFTLPPKFSYILVFLALLILFKLSLLMNLILVTKKPLRKKNY
uniref:NADH dehydrogenase subunit 6 n=1 Tax=Orancistrocerus aterrimus TaxID=2485977 RepID=A0A3G3FXI6_9HYME|nr:NADH dehydrogenase subunit 6 [Orancistrocerus aterrimus]AYQ18929.1 NADH dehydrogenase subunit 6 [Orancistrocerus aterrimus]